MIKTFKKREAVYRSLGLYGKYIFKILRSNRSRLFNHNAIFEIIIVYYEMLLLQNIFLHNIIIDFISQYNLEDTTPNP